MWSSSRGLVAVAVASTVAAVVSTSVATVLVAWHVLEERRRRKSRDSEAEAAGQGAEAETARPPAAEAAAAAAAEGSSGMHAMSRYLDLSAHPFKHARVFAGCESDVRLALDRIGRYSSAWLSATASKYGSIAGFVSAKRAADSLARVVGDIDAGVSGNAAPDVLVGRESLIVAERARVIGGVFDLTEGSVYVGPGTLVETGAVVKGPAIFGEDCAVRSGAYVRGEVIAGDGVVIRGEIKKAILLDGAEICHTSYVGDSILGYKAHLAAHAVTANLPLLASGGKNKALDGRRKFGAVVGDRAQIGASAVTSPGTFLAKNTHVYPLVHVRPGCYGPDAIIKPAAAAATTRQTALRAARQQAPPDHHGAGPGN